MNSKKAAQHTIGSQTKPKWTYHICAELRGAVTAHRPFPSCGVRWLPAAAQSSTPTGLDSDFAAPPCSESPCMANVCIQSIGRRTSIIRTTARNRLIVVGIGANGVRSHSRTLTFHGVIVRDMRDGEIRLLKTPPDVRQNMKRERRDAITERSALMGIGVVLGG
ncbi:unnamed protein product [Fusarium graminearum]|uniref:Uncharacterized protein n=1 Tax=Gibberella zeae TaxID=5518 RepID=A0A4E9E997_GIBZA|nr:unnamed protein product [Fusarium graminearum]CAG1992425.1 unnamed protein product [Fusarium graminearum]